MNEASVVSNLVLNDRVKGLIHSNKATSTKKIIKKHSLNIFKNKIIQDL